MRNLVEGKSHICATAFDYSKSLIYSELVNNEDMQLYSYHTKQTEAKKLHSPKNQETE